MAGEVPQVSRSPLTPPARGTHRARTRTSETGICSNLPCAGPFTRIIALLLLHPEPGLAVPLHRGQGLQNPDVKAKATPGAGSWEHSSCVGWFGDKAVPKGFQTSGYSGTLGTRDPQMSLQLLVSHLGCCIQIVHLITEKKQAITLLEVWKPILCLRDPKPLQVRSTLQETSTTSLPHPANSSSTPGVST